MLIHTFAKRVDRERIVTSGMFNAQEIKELERLGYRQVRIEKVNIFTTDKLATEAATNKNGIPVQGERKKRHDHEKRNPIRGIGRASRTR
ncbi:hypothetical protein [Tetzosporium hominis]|uniref:hypothetical protein n=1 Tax=Tetzosporium hominis TaxID=2020506 RepID=UPI001056E10C|nr:hypothetical protein [Tetzosporium hominis]